MKNRLLFSSARVILDDETLKRVLAEKQYSYITGLSYNLFDFGRNVSVKNKKTVSTDITKITDEQFLSQCSDTTRNEIRKTFKIAELDFKIPDENLDGVYNLYTDFEVRGKRITRARDYFAKSLLAGAYYKGKLIAAIICYNAFPVLRVNAIVSERNDEEFRRYVSFATRRLIFELFLYSKENKYNFLDLGGVNMTDSGKAGITAFKMSFGGELLDEYTYTYKSLLYRYVNSFFHKRG